MKIRGPVLNAHLIIHNDQRDEDTSPTIFRCLFPPIASVVCTPLLKQWERRDYARRIIGTYIAGTPSSQSHTLPQAPGTKKREKAAKIYCAEIFGVPQDSKLWWTRLLNCCTGLTCCFSTLCILSPVPPAGISRSSTTALTATTPGDPSMSRRDQ